VEKREMTLKEYIKGNRLDIDKVVEDYYGYIYMIIKNIKSIGILEEDMEEIISDVFLALWKNHTNLTEETKIKPYLAGIAKNILKNKYRKTKIDYSISDYEEQLVSPYTLEIISEEREQNEMIRKSLRNMKPEEYQIFMAFYYENRKIKEIAKKLDVSESKVKVVLHRLRKELKDRLKKGGYSYGNG
jgi:RNA polymerase sigma-70 factor (ECF subfamily)